MKTYRISTWSCEADDFTPEYRGLTKWGIRTALRELREQGWAENFSILVEREEPTK